MKRNTLWIGVLFVVLMLSAASCRKPQRIQLSKNQLVFTYSGGDDVFQVTANCEWSVTGMPDWITVNPTFGEKDANVAVKVSRNNSTIDRSAMLTVVSSNGKASQNIEVTQTPVDISAIVNKLWFARTEERWNSDYYDVVIPESYRSWTYYTDAGYEQWFFYFRDDNSGYQVHIFNNDTVFYPYQFVYEPDYDSLLITFDLVSDSLPQENYHTVVHQLDNEYLVFSHAYRPHQFEKITAVNVTGNRNKPFRVNPNKIGRKPKGPIIPVN